MLNRPAGVCRPPGEDRWPGNGKGRATVTQHTVADRANSMLGDVRGTAPQLAVRFAGALLAVAIAAVHVADQGGVTAMASPDWLGWGFRLVEAGGILTALVLLLGGLGRPRSALGWAAGVLLGAGPFTGYIASRTVGVPGDPGDVGNWGYWVGTESLLVEAALVLLSVSMLLAARQRR